MIIRGKRKLPLFHWLLATHSQSPPWQTFTVPAEHENRTGLGVIVVWPAEDVVGLMSDVGVVCGLVHEQKPLTHEP